MLEYIVLKEFAGNAVGEKVKMNKRQALHLELGGFIKPAPAKKATKPAGGGK